jgi:hypothetical protein
VAGFAMAPVQAKRLRKAWRSLFPNGCHMKELSHRTGRFKGLSSSQSNQLLVQAIGIIKARFSFGVCVSVQEEEMRQVMPRWVQGFEHPYPVLCHFAMVGLGVLIDEVGGGYFVDYVIEAGHAKQGSADRWMRNAIRAPETIQAYRYESHQFVANSEEPCLQAADILAWEYAKYVDEGALTGPPRRPMRRSLDALFRAGEEGVARPSLNRWKFLHLSGESLEEFGRKATQIALGQVEEERAATEKK